MPSTSLRNAVIRRVAMVTPAWPGGSLSNGIVNFIARTRDAMGVAGVDVAILACQVTDHSGDCDVFNLGPLVRKWPTWRLWRRLLGSFDGDRGAAYQVRDAIIAGLRRLDQAGPVQLLEMEESYGWAGMVKKRVDMPVVVRLHGPWCVVGKALGVSEDTTFHWRVQAEGEAIRLADGINAPSRDVIERVERYYGIRLPHAVVIPVSSPRVSEQEQWNQTECDADRVLFIGRFDRVKGGDVIIDAFARLAARMPGVKLWFVGPDRGLLTDDGRNWRINDYLAHRLGGTSGADRVEWLGEQPHGKLSEFRRRAQVTVICSRYESFGGTLIEAMAMGCPVVASRVGGLTEVVTHGVNGLQCQPGSVDDLAEQIQRLLVDPALATRLGRQAATDCRIRYRIEEVADQLLHHWNQVLAANQRGCVAV
jgi:glycosyltransferase involved in cell wall biosynthesis